MQMGIRIGVNMNTTKTRDEILTKLNHIDQLILIHEDDRPHDLSSEMEIWLSRHGELQAHKKVLKWVLGLEG